MGTSIGVWRGGGRGTRLGFAGVMTALLLVEVPGQ